MLLGQCQIPLGWDARTRNPPNTACYSTALGLREDISIYGNDYDTKDGTCIRDYVHVCDLADAHIRSLETFSNENYKKENCYIFNLGNGCDVSVKDVIDIV